jgi:hypothetical protein
MSDSVRSLLVFESRDVLATRLYGSEVDRWYLGWTNVGAFG